MEHRPDPYPNLHFACARIARSANAVLAKASCEGKINDPEFARNVMGAIVLLKAALAVFKNKGEIPDGVPDPLIHLVAYRMARSAIRYCFTSKVDDPMLQAEKVQKFIVLLQWISRTRKLPIAEEHDLLVDLIFVLDRMGEASVNDIRPPSVAARYVAP